MADLIVREPRTMADLIVREPRTMADISILLLFVSHEPWRRQYHFIDLKDLFETMNEWNAVTPGESDRFFSRSKYEINTSL